MLVLTRKTQQQIQIGSNITITILKVKGQTIRVGIEAPRDVCVLRTELAEKLAAHDDSETVRSALAITRREEKRAADVERAAEPAVSAQQSPTPQGNVTPATTLVTYRGPRLGSRGRRRLMMVASGVGVDS
jgi:carbon storage regulator CsrA